MTWYYLLKRVHCRLHDFHVFSTSCRADDPEKKPKTLVDVGCGIGGSSRYLAKKYGAQCKGITLSPVQAERGNALAAAQGLSDQVLAATSACLAN
jgi:ubiquinone/menaquinone biosynthesis C-methylase UbiE